MNIDSIITEWTYRLEKGYPDSPEDYQELRNVLQEKTDLSVTEQDAIVRRAMGLEEEMAPEPNSVNDTEFSSLIQKLHSTSGKTNKVTGKGEMEELADYTKKNYSNVLPGDIPTIFKIKNYINNVNEDGYYVIGDEISNKPVPVKSPLSGIQKESIIFTYMNSNYGTNIEHIESQAAGMDGKSSNNTYEVKTAQGGQSPNLNLQTTFYSTKPNKLYIVAFGDTEFDVYIISSNLLYRLSLGEEIYDQIQNTNTSDILRKQIQDGLVGFNFEDQIVSAILTGDTKEFKKSFRMGNNIGVRFKIEFYSTKFNPGQASDGENDNLSGTEG